MSGSVERVTSRGLAARDVAEDRLAWPAAALLLVVASIVAWAGISVLAMAILG